MIKSKSIKNLIFSKVVNLLEGVLEKRGFKYFKSKGIFIKRDGIFHQIINLNEPYSPIEYNDETEELFLHFIVYGEIEIPDYEKWYNENVEKGLQNLYSTSKIKSRVKLDLEDFEFEDFYQPTKSQMFKNAVTIGLGGGQKNENVIKIEQLISDKLPEIVKDLEDKSNMFNLFESREHPNSLRHYLLLLYSNTSVELVKQYFQKSHENKIQEIEEKLKISEAEASQYIEALNFSIDLAKKLLNIELTNPFSRSIKVVPNGNENLDFTQKSKFKESLRIDISQFKVASHNIDKSGNVLLVVHNFTDTKTIFVLDKNGNTLFEKELKPRKGFEPFRLLKSGAIEQSNEFYVNNFIIRNNNELIELELPKIEKKKTQKSNIFNFVYDIKREKYLLLYENYCLTYNKNGTLENDLVLPYKEFNYHSGRIIPEKQWIITKRKDKELFVLDFQGQVVNSFEYSNGNNLYEFSNDLNYLICFFYAVKSQFFDLEKEKKETLWAHPTYIKDYKESMYNDVSHNFGMEKAKFSPDNQYIIGGACHGKYVAWTIPKLERKELIPSSEVISLLENSQKEYKLELVQFGKETFFKNRGNRITDIFFLENGDFFLTVIGDKYSFVWNRDFGFIKCLQLDATINQHSNLYFTKSTKNEVVVFKLEE
jgi:WD40 repeat protein